MKDIFIVVPTLDPDEKIMETFINDLHKEFNNILIVNDGSAEIHDDFFKSLEKKGLEVFKHYKNLGKGRAIKNAFNYLLNKYPNIKGCVTCDCDGQHSVKDIKKIAKAVLDNKESLILGVRDFDQDNVPFKSHYGNIITRNIFKILIGLDITDTQTGLRGFSKYVMYKFIDVEGERFEYETNMLISCKEEDIDIDEIPIETIYINSNSNSHFHPLKDSILIYRLFAKYFLSSFSSFIVDIILFCIFFDILGIKSKILAATILARIVSSIYNYIINSKLVFKNVSLSSLIKYYVLAIIQMFMSGCFVTYLSFLLKGFPVVAIKIIVDTLLWVINLVILREFVFKGKKK